MSRTVKTIFTLSILLNILLITVSAGMYHKRMHPRFGPDKDMRQELSEDSRQLIRESFMSTKDQLKPVFEELRTAKDGMEEVLQADVFNEADFDAAADRLMDARDQLSRKMAENSKNFLGKLPPEDRKAMAKHMVKKMSGHGRGGPKGDRDRDGPNGKSRERFGHKMPPEEEPDRP